MLISWNNPSVDMLQNQPTNHLYIISGCYLEKVDKLLHFCLFVLILIFSYLLLKTCMWSLVVVIENYRIGLFRGVIIEPVFNTSTGWKSSGKDHNFVFQLIEKEGSLSNDATHTIYNCIDYWSSLMTWCCQTQMSLEVIWCAVSTGVYCRHLETKCPVLEIDQT